MEDDDAHRIGCLFPGKCCMPGEHFVSECHTAEMMEAYYQYLADEDPEVQAGGPGCDVRLRARKGMATHEIKITAVVVLEIEADDLAHACSLANDFGDDMIGASVPLWLEDCVKVRSREVSLSPDSENIRP